MMRAQRLVELAFQELGPNFHLYRVTSGKEALRFLTHAEPFGDAPTPDLILSNLNMPGMSGIELLGKLQASLALKDIPVVVFSSSRLDSDRARCLAIGAKRFITKPNNYDDFISAVKSVCGIDGLVAAESV